VGDQSEFAYQGHIDFVNNRLDPNTGTITIRGTFDNPDGRLIPGFSARLRILAQGPHLALLVPEPSPYPSYKIMGSVRLTEVRSGGGRSAALVRSKSEQRFRTT
jgi:multidrug efflux pump subunit AcrA (membrane-fusion protein)